MDWRRCVALQCRRRRPAPNKKPAAANAAGFDHGRFPFPRGMRCRRPPFDAAGGGACDAAGDRVLFSHSLLQGTSAWAKPNHGFSDCQQPVANFFRGAGAPGATRIVATTRTRCAVHARRHAHACGQMQKRWEKRDFPDASLSPMNLRASRRGTPTTHAGAHGQARLASPGSARAASPLRVAQARLRKTARTFPRGADDRRTARASCCAPENEEPAAFAAGSDDACRPTRRISGLRLPAVRRSRPGRAVR